VYGGALVTLSGTAVGNFLTYTWFTDSGSSGATWTALPSSNTNSYVFNTTSLASNTYEYELVVANGSGSVTSSIVNLYFHAASGPVVATQTVITPPNQFVGGAVSASATFAGTLPLFYQWQFNNGSGPVSIAGATNATYPIASVQFTNAGAYSLIASNSVGGSLTVTSSPASLVIYTPPTTNTAAVIVDATATPPPLGSYDISQLTWTAPTLVSNLNVFVNNNPGQTFTTGNTPPTTAGYPLNALYVLQELSTIGGGLSGVAESYTLGIYKMIGTNSVLLTTYTSANTLAITSGGPTDGDWIQWTGLTNMLATNTTYAFSIHNNGAGYWKLGNDGSSASPDSEGDLYPGGQIATLPTTGIGTAALSSDSQVDAAFVVVLTPPSIPVVVSDTSITPSTCFPGQSTKMSAFFTGANPIHIQWQFIDTNSVVHLIPGATNNIYTITNVAFGNSGTYSLLASNALTSGTNVSSTPQVLTVVSPPTTFVENFSYNINYSGVGPVPGATGSYWNEINGTSQNLTSYADDGATPLGTIFSAQVLGTFASGATTIGLFQNYFLSQNQTTNLPFSFSNLPNGAYNLTLYSCDGGYVHSETSFTVGGVTQTAIATTAASFIQNNNYVTFTNIVVTNGVINGTYADYSSEAAFNGASLQMTYSTLNPAITITTQPASQSVLVGQPASFSVAAFGAPPLRYQWVTNGVPVPHATNSTYAANTSMPVTWTVSVVITNSTAPTVTSDGTAVLTVRNPDSLVWTGVADGTTWDLSTLNWSNSVSHVNGVAYLTLDNVLFNDTTANNSIILNSVLTPSSVTVNTASTYTFGGSGSLSGVTGLTKTGPGTLVLPSANSYTGGTTLKGGQLNLGNPAAIGAGALTISNAAIDNISGSDMTLAPSVAQNWNGNFAYVGSANALNTGSNSVSLNANVQVTVGANTLTVPGVISDNGNNYTLATAGTGTLVLTNYETYTGGTIVNGGTLVLGKGNATGTILNNLAIYSGGLVSLKAVDALGYGVGTCVTIVNIAGGTLDNATAGNEGFRTSFNLTGGTMSSSGGGNYNMDGGSGVVVSSQATNVVSTISGNIALRSSGVVFSIAQGTAPGGIDLNISGVISGGGDAITKSGSGTLLLSGVNTYTGNTTISGGTLLIGGSGQLASGSYAGSIINSATFNYDSSAAQTLSGVISGTGAVQQNGPGLLTLSGANNYTGNTMVNAGTLEIVQPVLATSSTVTVASGGAALQLDFTGVTNQVSALVLGGVNKPAGVYNSSTPGGYITGGGSLLVQSLPATGTNITFTVSGSTLTLNWPASYIGWLLQSNAVSLANPSQWFLVPGSAAVNQEIITVNPAKTNVFYRMVHP
jgi:autotransporter-associated beta strand protein